MATNDFQSFAGGVGANVLSQSDWLALAALGAGFSSGVAPSAACNKAWRQSSIMSAVVAQLIVDNTGQNATDDGTTATLLANLKAAMKAQSIGLIGQARNLKASLAAAGASLTLTADQIIVGAGLTGLTYLLSTFNKTVNLATTGAGGMDTGTAPVSGYVALYAIYNPSTATSALLAVNATSAAAPNVYGGANMPSGYTASALVSVWPTNASSQFVVGIQADREIVLSSVVSNTYTSALSNASVTLAVPLNARTVNVAAAQTTATAATSYQLGMSSTSPVNGGTATFSQALTVTTAALTSLTTNGRLTLLTPQTAFATWLVVGGTSPSLQLTISSYSF